MHIAGTRHLIDLALGSPRRRCPRLNFLSTLAAAIEYKGPSDTPIVGDTIGQILVPEKPIDDFSMVIQDQGYGQSKYVCERIIVNAISSGLRATVCRVGQLSGMSTNGQWSKYEYSTILLRAIMTMRICPTDMPVRTYLASFSGFSRQITVIQYRTPVLPVVAMQCSSISAIKADLCRL